jgi:integrase
MHRLFKLAVYPARVLTSTPFPPGWLPLANSTKEGSFLYPCEDEAFLANTAVPLVKRILVGFCAREGTRMTNAAAIEWSNLSLATPHGGGHVVLDKTKNGRGASWALDPGTAEGLRRWRRICPSDRWVFPSEALPRSRRSSRLRPLNVGHIANDLRDGLIGAGVARKKLFESSDQRMRLRAHDLRATFVTLALANGRSEDWVRTRTGHSSSQMIVRYKREAQTAQELNLGWLKPLDLAIPELAEMSEPKLQVLSGG